jgi:hypothetical protein
VTDLSRENARQRRCDQLQHQPGGAHVKTDIDLQFAFTNKGVEATPDDHPVDIYVTRLNGAVNANKIGELWVPWRWRQEGDRAQAQAY